MIPTLLIGDYLFVSKFPYGYSRFSFDFFGELIGLSKLPLNIGGKERRIWSDPPKRGDIAVFKLPRDNSVDYIKRIIGLPGDHIQMIEGVLHINGAAVGREILEGRYPHKDRSSLAGAARAHIPVTVHAAIGTDIHHMHPSADGAALGALEDVAGALGTLGMSPLSASSTLLAASVVAPSAAIAFCSVVIDGLRSASY